MNYKLKDLNLGSETTNSVLAMSARLKTLRDKRSKQKEILHDIENEITRMGNLSLSNIDDLQYLLDIYKKSLRRVQQLKEQILTVRASIKRLVFPAKKRKLAESVKADDKGINGEAYFSPNKNVKVVLTVDESLKFLKTLTDTIANRPKDAKRVEIIIDPSKIG